MAKKDLLGIAFISLLFVVLLTLLALIIRPGARPGGTAEDSIFVQQRIKNIEKSK